MSLQSLESSLSCLPRDAEQTCSQGKPGLLKKLRVWSEVLCVVDLLLDTAVASAP